MRLHRFGIHPSWVIVFAGVCAALHVGKMPPALPMLQATLDISLVQAGFLLSVVQMAGMVLGLAVGLSADSWGLRRTMLTGLWVLSFASMAGGFVTQASNLHKLANAIGSAVEDELRFSKFHAQHGDYYETIIRDFKKKGTKS